MSAAASSFARRTVALGALLARSAARDLPPALQAALVKRPVVHAAVYRDGTALKAREQRALARLERLVAVEKEAQVGLHEGEDLDWRF